MSIVLSEALHEKMPFLENENWQNRELKTEKRKTENLQFARRTDTTESKHDVHALQDCHVEGTNADMTEVQRGKLSATAVRRLSVGNEMPTPSNSPPRPPRASREQFAWFVSLPKSPTDWLLHTNSLVPSVARSV